MKRCAWVVVLLGVGAVLVGCGPGANVPRVSIADVTEENLIGKVLVVEAGRVIEVVSYVDTPEMESMPGSETLRFRTKKTTYFYVPEDDPAKILVSLDDKHWKPLHEDMAQRLMLKVRLRTKVGTAGRVTVLEGTIEPKKK